MSKIKRRGFGTHKELAKTAGADGGKKSRGGGVTGDSKRASQIAKIRWDNWRAKQADQEIKEVKSEYNTKG